MKFEIRVDVNESGLPSFVLFKKDGYDTFINAYPTVETAQLAARNLVQCKRFEHEFEVDDNGKIVLTQKESA